MQIQSAIKLDRTYDVYWLNPPQRRVRIIKNRREKYWGTQTRMPIILRNLAPETTFDPRVTWDREKEAEEAEAAEEAALAAEAAGADAKKPAKGAKAKKPSKADEMRAANEKKQVEDSIRRDWEKLDNAAKGAKKGDTRAVLTVKPATPEGKLRQMLLILKEGLDGNDHPMLFDVLWAIEAHKVYKRVLAEEADADDAKDDKKGGKDDKKDKKGKDDKPKAAGGGAKKSLAAEIVHSFKAELKKAKRHRKDAEIVRFQLTEMHDRLPPLSRFSSGFKLDQWQKDVLALVEKEQSVVVCAPTSSGKTIMSTFVTVSSAKVLFVVPTEPLVWQVAAMFEKLLTESGQVALATNQMCYNPKGSPKVVVGTPLALESSLSKVRGLVGAELLGKSDYSVLDGGFDFSYAVYDEVHSLDGDEGDALQRLMTGVSCPFLALSATIGNGDALRSWCQKLRNAHGDAAPAGDGPDDPRHCNLVEHEGRFINLQRYVWDDAGCITPLHPCAAMSVASLAGGVTRDASLAFTPGDTIALWDALASSAVPKERVKDLEPNKFFGALFGGKYSEKDRVTLAMSKQYEVALKARLAELAADAAVAPALEKVLTAFKPPDVPPGERAFIVDLAMEMKRKNLFPGLCFQLDSFKALELFKDLLRGLEEAQTARYPEYVKELLEKKQELEKSAANAAKHKSSNEKENEEAAMDGHEEISTFVDTAAPHPEFVLAPPTARITAVEFDDIIEEIKEDTQKREALEPAHPYMRALRRGIGIYIDDSAFSVYRRVVQRLAQQGKLAIVFSDQSLAYGVNMPFRTCCFCGDMEGLLTPLMAQQMQGRTGRRGLDTQGNVIFVGMQWREVRETMLGVIPAIEGIMPLFPTIALSSALAKYDAGKRDVAPTVDETMLARMCDVPFAEYQRRLARAGGGAAPAGGGDERPYIEVSREIMRKFGFIDADDGVVHPGRRMELAMIWELRRHLPESLAIAHALPLFMSTFVEDRPLDAAENEAVQIEFYAMLLHFVDRRECTAGETPLAELNYFTKNEALAAQWAAAEQVLVESQDRLAGLPEEAAMRVKVPAGTPLDATIFDVLKSRGMPKGLKSTEKYDMRNRLWNVGNMLLKMHNCLAQPGDYQLLEPILRKTFSRIRCARARASFPSPSRVVRSHAHASLRVAATSFRTRSRTSRTRPMRRRRPSRPSACVARTRTR